MPFQEFEFKNFEGIKTNIALPGKNSSKQCLNLDIHSKPGSLTVREGYALRYLKPVEPRIENISFLNFDNFFDTQTDNNTEITLLVSKGAVISSDTANEFTLNGLQFWARPFWNGTDWDSTAWQWLNETNITNILEVNTNGVEGQPYYPYFIKVKGVQNVQNWHIINYTKNEIASVLSSVVDGENTNICHSKHINSWQANDVILLMRNYIPLAESAAMYETTAKEITFHKILNDIVVGFGSKPDRIGVNIGLRQKSFKLKNLVNTPVDVHPNISNPALLETVNEVNKIVLSTYNIYKGDYGLNFIITKPNTGGILTDKRYFKMTGVLDDFEETLVLEKEVECRGMQIQVSPKFRWGDHNPRLSYLNIYMAIEETGSFELLRSIDVSDREYKADKGTFLFNQDGTVYYDDTAVIELNTVAGILCPYSNDNSLANIVIMDSIPAGATIQPDSGALKINGDQYGSIIQIIYPIPGLKKNSQYLIGFKAKGSKNCTCTVTLIDTDKRVVSNWVQLNVGASFPSSPLQTVLKSSAVIGNLPHYIRFEFSIVQYYWLNDLSVRESLVINIVGSTTGDGEISALLGYTPSGDIVKSWDQALVFNGRTYFLNPYIDKSYQNKIMFSVIAGNGAFMYSVVTPENYLDVEKFNGQKCVGMALMQNLNLLVLKDNSALMIDPQDNSMRELGLGIGARSKLSIVNMEGDIYWASQHDIYMIGARTGYAPINLTEGSIRDKYRAIVNKSGIIAIREKYNFYCFVISDPVTVPATVVKTEYILTNRGWIQRTRKHHPESYQLGLGNLVWFMNQGDIYSENFTSDFYAGYSDINTV